MSDARRGHEVMVRLNDDEPPGSRWVLGADRHVIRGQSRRV